MTDDEARALRECLLETLKALGEMHREIRALQVHTKAWQDVIASLRSSPELERLFPLYQEQVERLKTAQRQAAPDELTDLIALLTQQLKKN